jgi:RNA polymerase sigma-70 factor (ECF subfamily)
MVNAPILSAFSWFPPEQPMEETMATEPIGADAATDSDAGLMLRVQGGDLAAFERLVEAHQSRVIGTVFKMLGGASDAEDIAQQVFIRVWKSAGRYRPTARFSTWLMTITRNLVFNEIRRRKRHPTQPIPTDPETGRPREFADLSARRPDDALRDRELEVVVQEAIDALPEVQRMALVLWRYEAMSYEEIAAVMGVSVPALKSLLFRARTTLKESLRKYLHPET